MALEAFPEFVGGREDVEIGFLTGQEVMLDDPVAVCGIGELQVEDQGIVLGLLQAVPGVLGRPWPPPRPASGRADSEGGNQSAFEAFAIPSRRRP
jgi:hypothetical protein